MLITIILIIDIEEDGQIITVEITDTILITEKKVNKGVGVKSNLDSEIMMKKGDQ